MKKKIVIPVLVLLAIIVGIGIYGFNLLDKVENVEIPEDDEGLGIKEEVVKKQEEKITNVALFGIDKRSQEKVGRSDSIMIASLDTKHKKIKLTSIMRDTYVDIDGRGMDKLNHAYAFGGPELAIKTINQNFDMNIREFATVDFDGLEHIVDEFGGIEVDIKPNEVSHVPGSREGKQLLDGKQALAYSRIRKTGDGDFERTERQRFILEKIINQGLNMGVTKYPKLLNTLIPFVETSLSKTEMLQMGTSLFVSNIKTVEKFRIPVDDHSQGQKINGIYYLVPMDLEDNVKELHEFIFEEKYY